MGMKMNPGNHEYSRDMTLDPHWRPQFTLPDNGPQGLKETCFFVDYEDLRLISLDSDMINESEWAAKAQELWLDSVLTHHPMKWTAVMLHHPFYSTKPNRDNTELRTRFGPILEKHNVDLVLQGHDHGYARGMEKIPSFINPDTTTNTMFVVSVSGAKMYDVSEERWMTRRAVDTQLFQIITIEKDTLNFKAYTATGELYDAFDMVKQSDSKKRLINRIPKVAERVTRKQ
jgi:3',5'-cyclic AMP phosphodiesterase CpdA